MNLLLQFFYDNLPVWILICPLNCPLLENATWQCGHRNRLGLCRFTFMEAGGSGGNKPMAVNSFLVKLASSLIDEVVIKLAEDDDEHVWVPTGLLGMLL